MPYDQDTGAILLLLERSDAFEEALQGCFPDEGLILAMPSSQHELVASACSISIEHARVLRASFSLDAPHSGTALLRLQFEALLRGAWLLFAATPSQIEKLSATLGQEAEQAAKNLPSYSVMLEEVVKRGPEGLTAPLVEFNQNTRHALNSFVHTGIHPLQRHQQGYPPELAQTLVKFSNAIMHLAYRILASLAGSQLLMNTVTRKFYGFADCLPVKGQGLQ
ncbi:DUF6988 family protein [Malikia granosa]|uniref:Uncharacterized protein n=1 Tax=Malikia granosa TaxID=263067 RepID=A0A2S9K1L1_9BURK|nr:hypothetical protein [Malikia granosa]PRD64312.1 hypothetical protein C6P64_15100 [Malikia granosa]